MRHLCWYCWDLFGCERYQGEMKPQMGLLIVMFSLEQASIRLEWRQMREGPRHGGSFWQYPLVFNQPIEALDVLNEEACRNESRRCLVGGGGWGETVIDRSETEEESLKSAHTEALLKVRLVWHWTSYKNPDNKVLYNLPTYSNISSLLFIFCCNNTKQSSEVNTTVVTCLNRSIHWLFLKEALLFYKVIIRLQCKKVCNTSCL